MKARRCAELTTTELPDELQFRVVRYVSLRGWIKWFVQSAIGIIVAALLLAGADRVFGWKDSVGLPLLACIYIGMVAPAILAYWLKGRATELRITSDGLIASGNIGDIFSKQAVIATSEVFSLGWRSGGLLLVREGFWRRPICVLPGLNEKQGNAVMKSIAGRFPDLWEEYLQLGYRLSLRPWSFSASEDKTPEIEL
jgi:hypothetical protein